MKTKPWLAVLMMIPCLVVAEEIHLRSGSKLEASKVEKTHTGLKVTTRSAEMEIDFERLGETTARKYFPERFVEADKIAREKAEAARAARLRQIEEEHKRALERARLAAYEGDKEKFVVVDRQFVERENLKELSGIIREKRKDGTVIGLGLPGHNRGGAGGNALLRHGAQVARDSVFVKGFFPKQEIGDWCDRVHGCETNPVGGIRVFDVGRPPTIEEWEQWKTAKSQKPVP